MKWLVRYTLVLATFAWMPCAHAATTTQGGACPSTANMDGGSGYTAYGGPFAAPTNCYYVDFQNGSDSNTGTSESSPFKHAVGMMGAGGNVPTSCSSGVGWIFRGGTTWNYTIAPWYIGTNANCTGDSAGNDSFGGCTGAHCVYFGVDHSWYAPQTGTVNTSGTSVTWVSGQRDNGDFVSWLAGQTITINGAGYTVASVQSSSALTLTASAGTQTGVSFSFNVWTRPIFSWGGWSNPSTPTCYYDSQLNYNNGTPGFQPTNFFNLSYQTNIIVDNFEFTGMCSAGTYTPGVPPFANYIAGTASNGYYTIENCYFHGVSWSIPGGNNFTNGNEVGDFTYSVSFGNNASSPTYAHYTYNVADYSDSGPSPTYTNGYGPQYPVWIGEAVFGGVVYYDHSVAAYQGDATASQWGTVRDSYFYWASNAVNQNSPALACSGYSCAQHPHVANDGGCASVGGSPNAYWYNNVIDTAVYGQMWQPLIVSGTCNFYVFNNVITNVTNIRNLNFGSTSSGITFYFFNNTLECGNDSSVPITGVSYPTANGGSYVGPPAQEVCAEWGDFTGMKLFNTHFVTSNSAVICGFAPFTTCPSFTDSAGTTAPVAFSSSSGFPGNPADLITQSQSAANGQGYAYTQPYEFSPTSSSGATVGAGVNETSLCNSIPDPNAATACKMDTTYAVTYNATNHTAVCCSRTPNARPASGPWDVGAYEFSAVSVSAPQPPSGLTATVE
ncbi:MAG TPA: hypothetical protein VEJ46_02240 [Candidatus Acidoferrum sp.]|nr:hypothetical protein [Candidatus Acidoferrum sp.]